MLQKAKKETWKRTNRGDEDICYDVREQVGFLLRSAFQRHTAIFMSNIVASLTQTQLAAIATLYYSDPLAHNELGASVGLDASTIKGVIDRLKKRGLVKAWTNVQDRRSRTVTLTAKGRQVFRKVAPHARRITSETLQPLNAEEQSMLIGFLKRLT